MEGEKSIHELMPFDAEGLLIMAFRGSKAHGTYDPDTSDDVDYIAMIAAPKEYTMGLKEFKQRQIQSGSIDLVVYEVRKAISMFTSCNPNAVSLLWNRPEDYLVRSDPGDMVIKAREMFLSTDTVHSAYRGYAQAQINAMTAINKPYSGYMGAKRKALVDEIGYDAKYAGHAVRIARMGIELLSTGKINVWREDARDLMDIKNGRWTRERIMKEVEMLLAELDHAYTISKLPDEPDYEAINKLCVDVYEAFYYGKHKGGV